MERDIQTLPIEMLHAIFRRVARVGGAKSVLPLRLVCKSWQAAVKHLGLCVEFKEPPSSLHRLCCLFPGMTSLCGSYSDYSTDLWPLAVCTRLTRLDLVSYISEEGVSHEFFGLPKSLQRISMRFCLLSDAAFKDMDEHCISLLFCEKSAGMDTALWKHLRYLPKLEGLQITESDPEDPLNPLRYESELQGALKRLSLLTYLNLAGGSWLQPLQPEDCPDGLRSLSLSSVTTNYFWLESIISQQKNLTWLSLSFLNIDGSLRNLGGAQHEGRASDAGRSRVPPHRLLPSSLSYLLWAPVKGEVSLTTSAIFGQAHRLTALTQLTLLSVKQWKNAECLRQLPLQLLNIVESHHLEVDIFVPGCLRGLRKLGIWDDYSRGVCCCNYSALKGNQDFEKAYTARLQELACIVKSLPLLEELQGECSLYRVGIEGEFATPKFLPVSLETPL